MPFDVVKLDLQHARLGPFAIGTELNVANHRVEGVRPEIVRDFRLIGAPGFANGLTNDLKIGIGEGRLIIAKRIGATVANTGLVFGDERFGLWRRIGAYREPEIV